MKLNKAREKLVDMYVSSLKEDTIPWEKNWVDDPYYKPNYNPVSKTVYRGINKMLLSYVSATMGYTDPRWMTFNQIKGNGYTLEDAQGKGVPVEYWSVYDTENKETVSLEKYNRILAADPTRAKDFRMLDRVYYVFNAEHIKGIPELDVSALPKKVADATPFIENLIINMNVGYEEIGNNAFYTPQLDKVVVPKKEQFNSTYEYDAVRLHELAHATGSEKRLDRNLKGSFGSEDYAREELRAEITSSFISQEIALNPSQKNMDNHKAYVQNWISILDKEPNELFKAIKDAEKISEYLCEIGELEKFIEMENEEVVIQEEADEGIER